MLVQTQKTLVGGLEEVEETYIKKKSRFLFFKVESWERVNSSSVANDLFIETTRKIRDVYLNGEKIN